MRLQVFKRAAAIIAPLMLLGLAGCGSDTKAAIYEPITDPSQLYWRLTMNYSAITMAPVAPYDTLQLTATPFDAHGDTLHLPEAPTFHLANPADSVSVTVSSDGFLTARQPVTGLLVIAELKAAGNVRHADTALVNVTSDPPTSPLDRLTLDIVAPDSALWPVFPPSISPVGTQLSPDSILKYAHLLYLFATVPGGLFATSTPFTMTQRVHAVDMAGNPMPVGLLTVDPNGGVAVATGIVVAYRSLDPNIASITGGTGSKWIGIADTHMPGKARIVAQATAYGVTRADTLTFTVTPPSFVPFVAGRTEATATGPARSAAPFGGRDRTIRTNGVVMWMNALNRPVDVVFDQPANVIAAPAAYCQAGLTVLTFFGNFFFRISSPDPSYCQAPAGNFTLPPAATTTLPDIIKTTQLQQFPQAGTYTYHDALTGESGRIIVTDVAN